MNRPVRNIFLCMIMAAAGVSAAYAEEITGGTRPADCEQVDRLSRAASNTITWSEQQYRDLDDCIKRGWDPPVAWRPNMGQGRGSTTNLSGGIYTTALCPPDGPCPTYVPGTLPGGGAADDGMGTVIPIPGPTVNPEVPQP